ncbi:hypothetical protein JZ751_020281 [Albula glossodonta]|uniref:Fibronectin type-III domain-containing protein n=1 Tax=Albula glossodonta TaxID=121402 RepID=A0A8T2MTU7_9TELE|nr:hypothetical protein JZ751_020281 [Albula glossodonta]
MTLNSPEKFVEEPSSAVMSLPALGNVTVESKNLQSELRWTPVTGRESVKYKVQFEALNSDEWMDILGCSPTNKTHCNLTADNIEAMNVTLRVLVLDGNQTMLWGKSHPFHAITQSLLGPPTVTLHPKPENGQLSVRIDSSLQVGSNYCVQVSYAYKNQPRGNSIASTPNCTVIRESEAQRSVRVMWMTILGLVLLLVVLLLFYTGSRHYSKIKLALQPPLKLPLHLEQFLSGEERIPQFPGIISDPEEKCLEISEVIMEEEGGALEQGAVQGRPVEAQYSTTLPVTCTLDIRDWTALHYLDITVLAGNTHCSLTDLENSAPCCGG